MFEKDDSSIRQKMNGCSFQQAVQQNLSWLLPELIKPFLLKNCIGSSRKWLDGFSK